MRTSSTTLQGVVVRSSKQGKGVFATRTFKKGQIICAMQGRIASQGAPPTFKNRKSKLQHIEELYTDPLQIGPTRYILLDEPYIYFNHACNPNAGIRGTRTLFALRTIKPGEEITYDYATTVDESFSCLCGAKDCRGAISDFFALPKRVQARYARAGALPSFILRKYRRLITRR
jgi:SET domain-containing protein